MYAICEEASLIDLLGRCVGRVDGRDLENDEVRRAAHARLVSELELMRWGHLRSQSRRPDASETERERTFRLLLEVSGRQHGRGEGEERAQVLGAAQRLGSPL